ncbi:MAG: hypothetical protein IPO81_27735 [Kouleothrix sp.]|nr:hypothetical protein [Kouleothrix sp.]
MLPNGATLAASPRFQALVNANAQLGQLLADAPVGLDCHGFHDDSRSARRAIFVCQLVRARYPDDEIRALATHFADLLDSGRGDAIFRGDVDRLLAKYTPAGHTAAATRVTANQLARRRHVAAGRSRSPPRSCWTSTTNMPTVVHVGLCWSGRGVRSRGIFA